MESFASVFVMLIPMLFVNILGVPYAYGGLCEEDDPRYVPSDMTKEEYKRKHCCKIYYSDQQWHTFWLSCNHGCCGREDYQECCPAPKTKKSAHLGVIVGCSVFGVVVLILLIVLFVWIGKKCSTGIKDYKGHKELLRDVYSAKTLEELFVPPRPLVSPPGTIVHPVINVNSPYSTNRNESSVVPSPFQPQPSAQHLTGRRDDLDFGNEETWERWGEGGAVSPGGVHISPSGEARYDGRGRDHPQAQPPPAYDVVMQK